MLGRENSLTDAIIAVVDEKGIETVNTPSVFCAIIDDIIPQLENEKNIVHRSMNEKVAQYIVEAYYSENVQRDFILSKLDMYLKDSLGIAEEWRAIFLNSFSTAFSWNYKVEIESNRGTESVNEVVEKGINFSRYIPDIIATGASHIVGLKKDGTVIAVGDNSNGQCNVKSWKNVIAVSAWGFQTVGLLQDGSVLQTGSVALGVVADVSMIKNWNNMISVSAGATNIIGLRNNGKAFGCGANQSGQCDVLPWNNIIAVATGHGHTLGLKKDGTVVSAGSNKNGQCEVYEWNNIRAIAVGVSHSIGLRNDGTVVATGKNDYGECNVQDWNNIIAVKACLQHTIGLKSDGTVIVAGRYKDKYDVSGWTDIVSLDINCRPAGMGDYFMNIVGVKSDGTVVFAGDDTLGQGSVVGWNLFSASRESNLLSGKRRIKDELLREQECLVGELSQLRGMFSRKRRKEIEEKLLKIENELKRI